MAVGEALATSSQVHREIEHEIFSKSPKLDDALDADLMKLTIVLALFAASAVSATGRDAKALRGTKALKAAKSAASLAMRHKASMVRGEYCEMRRTLGPEPGSSEIAMDGRGT